MAPRKAEPRQGILLGLYLLAHGLEEKKYKRRSKAFIKGEEKHGDILILIETRGMHKKSFKHASIEFRGGFGE